MTRPPQLLLGPERRRPPRRRRGALLALAAGLAIVGTAVVVAITGGFAASAPEAAPSPAATQGTTTRSVYSRVRLAASRDEVIALLGSSPMRYRHVVRDGVPLDCVIYGRRSGGFGEYRFCFRNGYLWTKSAPPLGLSPESP